MKNSPIFEDYRKHVLRNSIILGGCAGFINTMIVVWIMGYLWTLNSLILLVGGITGLGILVGLLVGLLFQKIFNPQFESFLKNIKPRNK
jgi:hypothetical protein